MIKSNSSVIIKNHNRKENKKCSKDGENSEDDEEGENVTEDSNTKIEENENPMAHDKNEVESNDVKDISCAFKNKGVESNLNVRVKDVCKSMEMPSSISLSNSSPYSTKHPIENKTSDFNERVKFESKSYTSLNKNNSSQEATNNSETTSKRIRRKLPSINAHLNGGRKRFNNSLSTLESGEDSEGWSNEAFESRLNSSPNSSATSTLSSSGNIIPHSITYLTSLHEEARIMSNESISSHSQASSPRSTSTASSPQSEKTKSGAISNRKARNHFTCDSNLLKDSDGHLPDISENHPQTYTLPRSKSNKYSDDSQTNGQTKQDNSSPVLNKNLSIPFIQSIHSKN